MNYLLIFSQFLISETICFNSSKLKLTGLSIKFFNLSNVTWTSIIFAPKIAAATGARIFGQWFEYPSKSFIFVGKHEH